MEFVRMLCERIGPRPACSQAERDAAHLCAERLRAVGLEVAVEPFPSRPSATPWLASYLGLAAVGALLLAPLPLVAFVLSLVALLLYARDVDGRPLLPPRGGESVNVIARRPGREPSLVIVAELDSGRASPRFHPRFPPGPRGWALVVHAALVALPLASATAWVAESARPLPSGIWVVGAPLAAVLFLALGAEIYVESKLPLPDGANDNATGLEAVLRLSKRFPGGDVWWVLVGSGHVGQIGMQAFLEVHASELGGARILCLRGLGAGTLDAPADEGPLRLRRADPALLDAAIEAGTESTRVRSVQTAAAVALVHRRPAATLAGIDERGAVAGQSWTGDGVSQIDAATLARSIDVAARVVEVVTGEKDAARERPPLRGGQGST